MGKKIASLFAEIGVDSTKLKSGLSDAKTQLKETGQSGKTSMMELYATFQLAEQGARAIYQGLKQIYDFGKQGAAMEYTTSKFDNLAKSIGTTSDALMIDLKAATGGLVSDVDLMTSATDFMALGLVKTKDEAVRLTTVAGQLGMNMNQLVLTLTNQTTMRFDALGVSVAGFDEKVQKLKDSGMNANDAFNEAFLQQAEEQIETVGSITDQTVSSFMRFEASVKNLGTEIQKTSTGPIAGIVGKFADALDVLSGQDSLTNKFSQMADTLKNSNGTYEDYITNINKMLEGTGLLVDETGKLNATNLDGWVKLGHVSNVTEILTEDEWDLVPALRSVSTETGDMGTKFLELNGILPNTVAQTEAVYDATKDVDLMMRGYTTSLLYNQAAQGLNADQALLLAEKLGLVDPATQSAMGILQTFSAQLDTDSEGSLAAYNRKLQDMDEAIRGLQDKHITITQTTIYEEIRRNYEWREDLATGNGSGTQQAAGGPTMSQAYQWKEYGRNEMYLRPGENGGMVMNAQQLTETMRAAGITGGAGIQIAAVNIYPPTSKDFFKTMDQVALLGAGG